MHSTYCEDGGGMTGRPHRQITAIHHGDFSGDVEFFEDGKTLGTIPAFAIEQLVANRVRQDRVAMLEQANWHEILYGRRTPYR